MITSFNTNDQENEPLRFNTQEDWDKHVDWLHSLTPRMRPGRSPEKFPCIALEAGRSSDPVGPDIEHYAFLYNVVETEETTSAEDGSKTLCNFESNDTIYKGSPTKSRRSRK